MSVRRGANPLWSQSLFVLRHFPALLWGIALGALLLAASLALAPLFLSATASQSLRSSIAGANPYTSGFFAGRQGVLDQINNRFQVEEKNLYVKQNRALAHAAAGIPHLQPLVFTQISPDMVARHDKRRFDVHLLSRTDARQNITLLSGDRSGFLVPDTLAKTLHLEVGDKLLIHNTDLVFSPPGSRAGGTRTTVPIRVSGIYRNLVFQADRAFWSNLSRDIQPPDPLAPPPPPPIIGGRSEMVRVLHEVHVVTLDERWELPIDPTPPLTVEQAHTVAADLARLSAQLSTPETRLGRLFFCRFCRAIGTNRTTTQVSGIGGQVKTIDDRLTALTPPVQSVSGAGALVALAVITSAGIYGGRRRRTETSLLLARGWSPPAMAMRSTLETILPLVVGAGAGFLLARALVALFGPPGPTDPSIVDQTLTRVGIAVPIALAALFVVALLLARALTRPRHESDRQTRRFFPWEALVAAAAVAAYLSIGGGSISFEGSKATSATLVLLGFPLLVLVGASGILARLLRWWLRRTVGIAERMRATFFLAVSRLAVSTPIAIALLIAAATSLGLLSYAQAMVSSLDATTFAKASVFTGGDASVPVDTFYKPPKTFDPPNSTLYQITDNASFAGGTIGILAIDPQTFAKAALWSDHFSNESLEQLTDALDSGPSGTIPFVAVGSNPSLAQARSVTLQTTTLNVHAVGSAVAFPAIYGHTPWMVVDASRLGDAVESAGGTDPASLAGSGQMIVHGPIPHVTAELESLGFPAEDILTVDRILKQPTLVAAQSTLEVLRALGIAAGCLSVLALLLYLQVRQRERSLANALSTRMGLSERQHLLAVVLELGTIMLSATLIALVGGFAITVLTHAWLDPVPGVPPAPLLVLPALLVPALLLIAAIVSVAGAGLAQWSSHRAVLAEEMRRVG